MNLIVDANVLTSAVFGRSIDLLFDLASRGVRLLVPVRMMIEAQKVVERVAGLEPGEALKRVAALTEMVEVLDVDYYLSREDAARQRLGEAGQGDWPVLASALALDASIWSNDRDFFGVGVPVWSTYNVGLADTAEA